MSAPATIEDAHLKNSPYAAAEDAHDQLMRLYAAAISHTLNLSFFVKRIDVEIRDNQDPRRRLAKYALRAVLRPLSLRFLVRPFVESHISKRLKQLRARYRWAEQELATTDDKKPARAWFATRQEDLGDLGETLSPWTSIRSLARLLSGPAIGVLLIYLGGEELWPALFDSEPSQRETLGTIGFFLLVYLSVPFSASFAYKRSVFLSGPTHPTIDETRAQSEHNIYLAENRLWKALGMRKKPEPNLDNVCTTGVFLLMAPVSLVAALTTSESKGTKGILIAGAVLFTILGVGSAWPNRNRKYR